METKINQITDQIIGGAIEVHRILGPGLLESAYEACLVFELLQRGLNLERQKPLPIHYKGHRLDCGYRLDLLVENLVVVELKSVKQLAPIHKAQMLSYLALSGRSIGLLINFNEILLENGIRRVIHSAA